MIDRLELVPVACAASGPGIADDMLLALLSGAQVEHAHLTGHVPPDLTARLRLYARLARC